MRGSFEPHNLARKYWGGELFGRVNGGRIVKIASKVELSLDKVKYFVDAMTCWLHGERTLPEDICRLPLMHHSSGIMLLVAAPPSSRRSRYPTNGVVSICMHGRVSDEAMFYVRRRTQSSGGS
jgi:hypothetical protein